jgi:hypothetical protein
MENKKTQVAALSKKYFQFKTIDDLIINFPMKKGISEEIKKKEQEMRASFVDLLKGCLELDPRSRFTAEDARNHPFVTGSPFTGEWKPKIRRKSKQQNFIPKKFYNRQYQQNKYNNNNNNNYNNNNHNNHHNPKNFNVDYNKKSPRFYEMNNEVTYFSNSPRNSNGNNNVNVTDPNSHNNISPNNSPRFNKNKNSKKKFYVSPQIKSPRNQQNQYSPRFNQQNQFSPRFNQQNLRHSNEDVSSYDSRSSSPESELNDDEISPRDFEKLQIGSHHNNNINKSKSIPISYNQPKNYSNYSQQPNSFDYSLSPGFGRNFFLNKFLF